MSATEDALVEQVKALRCSEHGQIPSKLMQSVEEDIGDSSPQSTGGASAGGGARKPAIEEGESHRGGGDSPSGMAPQKPQKHLHRWIGIGGAFDGSEREELGGGVVLVGKQVRAQLPPPMPHPSKLASCFILC